MHWFELLWLQLSSSASYFALPCWTNNSFVVFNMLIKLWFNPPSDKINRSSTSNSLQWCSSTPQICLFVLLSRPLKTCKYLLQNVCCKTICSVLITAYRFHKPLSHSHSQDPTCTQKDHISLQIKFLATHRSRSKVIFPSGCCLVQRVTHKNSFVARS